MHKKFIFKNACACCKQGVHLTKSTCVNILMDMRDFIISKTLQAIFIFTCGQNHVTIRKAHFSMYTLQCLRIQPPVTVCNPYMPGLIVHVKGGKLLD